ncbi:MAG: glycosyltransferase family 2 protein [Candidatus Aenigmarchaeota archaeon]|nr:glycosyltransferase family 2 protein [Candidatus Aenigmarchaeota archaeon]
MVLELWLAIISALFFLAAAFWFLGWRWESTLVRPKAKGRPLVSIIIPAYKSEKTIRETIESAKGVSYKRKEILVVNDCLDKVPGICKELGVRVIQNKKRLGKWLALNNAIKHTKGEILFFLDADTVIEKDAISRIIPWFTKQEIAVVSPKYISQKSSRIIPRLASLENKFNSSLFKMDMYFGSMISFRGCGVAIRRSFFESVGGWSKTLIEDVDFAAKTLESGHKIQYEPSAVVRTREAETISELKSQRVRWGKGSAYSILNYKSTYSRNSQFSLHYFPYIFLIFGILGILFWQLYLLIPLMFLLALYSYSFTNASAIMLVMIIPLFYGFAVLVTGTLGHLTIVTWREKEKAEDIILLIPYLFFYYPLVIFFYFRGMISGFSQRRFGKKELNLDDWKC